MSFAEADARLAGIEPPPSSEEGTAEQRFFLVPLADFHAAGVRVSILILLGAVGLMLVVGCANLAGLQIARSLARRPEMATRQALGSGGAALVRQTLVENLLLGLVGGLSGLAVAHVAVAALEGIVQSRFGIWQDFRLDGRAVAAAAGLTALATLLFGLVPAAQAGRRGAYRLLQAGSRVVGRGGHRLRKALLVGQVALVTALLFGAGLLVRSYGHLEGLDPGFDPEGVLTVQFSLDDARYAQADAVRRLFDESLEAIRGIPGVSSAAVSLTLPYERALNTPFDLRGDETFRLTNVVYVTPGLFETLRIPLLQGRLLEEADREGAPIVAAANAAWVGTHVPDRPPLGTLLDIRFGGGEDVSIVGVVGNVQQSAGFGRNTQPVWETPTLYLSSAQADPDFFNRVHVWFTPSWIVRAALPPEELAPRLTRVFQQVDPDLPVARVATLREVMDRAFAEQRFEAAFLIAVSAFALLLAGIGLYGIVAHEVLERRTEMGLRMALGATPGRAVWAAGGGGIRLAALGLVVGGVATVGVARIMKNLIWGVAPYDPVILASLVGVLGLLAAVASFVPAARVGRMDPARILREG
jgi:predicted permease